MSNLGIKIVRILGHEDVIAKVKAIGHGKYRISDPCVIRLEDAAQTTEGPNGQKLAKWNLALSPFFMPYMKQDQSVEVEGILFEPDDRLVARYNQLFSPIIQPALEVNGQDTSKLIVPQS